MATDGEPDDEPMTWVMDRVFDPDEGWPIPASQATLTRTAGKDGNPVYLVDLDGVRVHAWETHEWDDDNDNEPDREPGRLVLVVALDGYVVREPAMPLRITDRLRGFPCFALGDEGLLLLYATLPIWPEFPVDVARRQIVICVRQLVHVANQATTQWDKDAEAVDPRPDGGAVDGTAPPPKPRRRGLFRR